MQNTTLIGIDLGKHSFHVHCQDRQGNALLRKKFFHSQLATFLATCPLCTNGVLCGAVLYDTICISVGHQVKLIVPKFVHPFVKTILLMLKLSAR